MTRHLPAQFQYVIILTHNRPVELAKCVEAISPQVDGILIVDNFSTPPADQTLTQGDTPTVIVRDDAQPPNIAKMWNRGLDRIEYSMKQIGVSRWDVAFLCDDVFAPPTWTASISATMRSAGAGAGSTHSTYPIEIPMLKVNPDRDLHNRMVGAAFMVVGENGQRADERMHWWWCDTDMDWQARLHFGGMILVPGPVAVNTRPNDFTVNVDGLATRAGHDGEEFAAKWGYRPW